MATRGARAREHAPPATRPHRPGWKPALGAARGPRPRARTGPRPGSGACALICCTSACARAGPGPRAPACALSRARVPARLSTRRRQQAAGAALSAAVSRCPRARVQRASRRAARDSGGPVAGFDSRPGRPRLPHVRARGVCARAHAVDVLFVSRARPSYPHVHATVERSSVTDDATSRRGHGSPNEKAQEHMTHHRAHTRGRCGVWRWWPRSKGYFPFQASKWIATGVQSSEHQH